MCGGEGIRLRPFTYIIPKPFLTTNNISPFDYIIQNHSVASFLILGCDFVQDESENSYLFFNSIIAPFSDKIQDSARAIAKPPSLIS